MNRNDAMPVCDKIMLGNIERSFLVTDYIKVVAMGTGVAIASTFIYLFIIIIQLKCCYHRQPKSTIL